MTAHPVSQTCCPSSKWRSLEQRRADTAHTVLYKIRNGHLLTSPTHLTPVMGILARAHPHHYVQYQTDTLVQKYPFYPHMVQLWNALPNTVAWLCHPIPSGIKWDRCSIRPETNLPPAMSPPWRLLHMALINTLTCASLPPPHGHNAQDWAGSIAAR